MKKTVSLLLVLWALWPMVAAAQTTDIEMTDTIDPFGEVTANEIVDVVVSFRNDNTEPMEDLTWTAALLPVDSFSFANAVDLQGAVVVSSSPDLVIEYPVDLLPGETLELRYRLRTTSCFSSQGSSVSHGGVWTATLPVNEPVQASTLTSLPIHNANSVLYDVIKTASVTEASPGDEIDFSIQVINQLAVFSAGTVFVRDVIPTGTTLVDAPDFACDGSSPGSLCENVIFLDCAETAEFSMRLRVADTIPASLEEIVNTAVATRGQFSEQGTAVVQLGGLFRDLTITKTDGGATAVPGEDLTYSFEVTNLGNTAARGVIVRDFLPQEVEFDAERNPRWSFDPGTRIAQYLGGSVPGGATQSFQLHLRVQDTLPAVDGFDNQAVVTTTDPETDTTNNSATEFTPIDESVIPDLDLALGAAQATVLPDGQVDYVVTITNLGPIGARDVGALFSFDALLEFLPGAGSDPRWQVATSQQIQAEIGTLGAGVSTTLAVRARAESGFPAGTTQIPADASTSTSDPEPDLSNNTAALALPVDSSVRPDLAIQKTDSGGSARPGEVLSYTIQVENLGTLGATSVSVGDILPTEVSWLPGSSDPRWSFSSGSLTADLGILEPSEAESLGLQVRVNDTLPAGTESILNESSTSTPDPEQTLDNNAASAETPLASDVLPDLQVTKTADLNQVEPGDLLHYQVEIRNLGAIGAQDVSLEDLLPQQVQWIAFDSDPRWQQTGNLLQADLGTLPGGATETLAVTVRIDEVLDAGTAEFTNTATAETFDDELDESNNSSTVVTPVDESVLPDLQLMLTSSQTTVLPGEAVEYLLTVTNLGLIGARDVEASFAYDDLLSFQPGTGSDVRWQDLGSQQLQADLGILGGGETTTLAVTTLAQSGFPAGTSEFSASGSTSTSDPEPDLTNNTATLALPLDPSVQSDLAIQKTASGGPARPGETLTYQVSVENLGSLGATSVVVEDVLPGETSWVPENSDSRWTFADGRLTAAVGMVEPSETESFGVEVRVNDTLPAGTESILNMASVETPDPEQTLENNTASAETPLAADVLPDLQVTKMANLAEVRPGDLLVYQVEVVNAGPIGTRNVSVEDVLPEQVQWIANDSDPRWQLAGNTLQADLGTLDGAASETLEVVVQIDGALDAGTTDFVNQAIATTSDTESDDGNNTDTVVTPLADDVFPDLRVAKELIEGTPSPGQQLLYAIEIENLSGIDSGAYTVTESLPTQVVFLPYDSSPEWTQTGQQLTAQFVNLEAGATRALEVAVQIPVDIDAGDLTLFNEVSVDAPADEESSNNTDSTTHDVILPDLAVAKSDQDAVAQPGLIYSYIISVTAENAPVTDIVVVEDLPDEVTWLPDNSDEIWEPGTDGSPTATIASLEAGSTRELLLTVQVSESLPAGLEELVNHVQVDSPMTDSNGSNEEATEITPIVEGLLPNLAVTKTASVDSAEVGDEFSYTILVESNGAIGATEVRVVDLVSPDTEIVDAGNWTCAGLECVFEGGALEVGESLELDLVVRVLDMVTSSVVVNQAQLTLPDTDSTDNLAEATVQLVDDGEPLTPDAWVDLLGPAQATVGETFQLEIPYGNASALQATEVSLTVALPAELEPIDLIDGWSCSLAAGWTCELSVGILPGLTETATALAILPSSEGSFEAQATITALSDGNLENNIATWSVVVDPGGPDPEVDVSVEKSGEQVGPQAVAWTIGLRSLGQLDATNIEIHDMLPDSTVEVDDPACSVDTGSCSWFLDQLPSGETTEWTFTTVHDANGLVTNEVQVQAPNDAEPSNDEVSASVTLVEPSVLAVQKRDRLLEVDEWPVGIPDDTWAVIEYEVVIDILESVDSPVFELIDSTSSELRYLGHFEGDGSVTVVDGSPEVSFSGEVGARVFRYLAGIQAERPQVRCQGRVRSDSHESVVSDDPDTPVLFDPTVTRFEDGGGGEDPYPIPTLSEWGLLLLVSLLGVVAARRLPAIRTAS